MAGGQALPGRNRRATARTQDPIVETEPVVDAEVRPKKAYRSLFAQILVAVVAGIAVGHFWSSPGADLKPIGDGFIKLVKMVIAPLILCVVVTGIAKVGDLRAVGSIPAAAVALLLGADRIMDSMRVFTNLLGNCVATFVVSRWEGLLDQEQMRRTLSPSVTD
jgi:Na+/H+-dicarboxylate symporter